MKYVACFVVFVISLGVISVVSVCDKNQATKCRTGTTYEAEFLVEKAKATPNYTSVCDEVQDVLTCGYKQLEDCEDNAKSAFLAIRDKYNKDPPKCGATFSSSVAIAPALPLLLIPLLVSLY